MNRTKTIAVFAGIFAIAMTTYGLTGISTSPMVMASMPQPSEGVGILGHAEFTVFDSNGQVKQYIQGDNVVVRDGTDCAAELLFGSTSTNCSSTGTTYRYIAIGNATTPDAAATDTELDVDGGTGCATSTVDGEQARKLVTPTQTDNTGSGTDVVLDVGTNTFKFDANNATTVTQSAIFNNDVSAKNADGSCGTLGSDWEMFAIRDLSPSVTVSSGDTLAVKWTITIS